MHGTGRIPCAAAGALVLLGSWLARADIIPLGGGWVANVADATVIDIFVDQVGPRYLNIEISKDFTEPPVGGEFPPRTIVFEQIADDGGTVPRIIITDEAATNLTLAPWTDYHWQLVDTAVAWFNVPLSAGFDTTPFMARTFSDPGGVHGDPDKATDLDARDGVVAPFETFFPGAASGALVIDVDLSDVEPVAFVFTQYPTPEPSGVLLVAAGVLGGLWRRR